MTKEEITGEQAIGYLKVLVALDNSQVAKDTLEYFENLQQENYYKQAIEYLKKHISIEVDRYYSGTNSIIASANINLTKGGIDTKEEIELLEEVFNND